MEKISIPPNLTELAYQNIKEAILQGKLVYERFTEESLSFSLGISKSPIREALNAHKNEGLIRIEPRRGVFLREFYLAEIRDLCGVRDNNKKLHIEEDAWLHRRPGTAAGNDELNRMPQTIQNQIWRAQTYDLSSGTAPNAHRKIIAALRKQDHVAAERAVRDYIVHVRDGASASLDRRKIALVAIDFLLISDIPTAWFINGPGQRMRASPLIPFALVDVSDHQLVIPLLKSSI